MALSQEKATVTEKGEAEKSVDEFSTDDEGRAPRKLRDVTRVSREEREEHEITHTPYRSWCDYCVKARARNAQHARGRSPEKSGVPKVSMDYFYMSSQDEAASTNPLIVMLDEETKEKYARAVGRKGLGEEGSMDWLVKDMSAEMRMWGHGGGVAGKVILKSDGERSLVAVRDAVGRYHGGRIIPELPAKGESQSNGAVEEAGKTVREYTRVLKEQVEDKAKIKLKPDDNIVQWMVRWAAFICSRYVVGKDGKTGYERRRGRRCKIPSLPFAECVWYKQIREGKDRQNKFDTEIREGIWLGHARESNEVLIGTDAGVVRAYSVERRDPDQRWNGALIQSMRGTPQQPDPQKGGINIPIRVGFDPPSDEVPGEAIPMRKEELGRRWHIMQKHLNKYGYQDNCEGCKFKRAGLKEQRPHSEECRERIWQAMAGDAEGQEWRRKEDERVTRKLAGDEEAPGEEQEEEKDTDVTMQNEESKVIRRTADNFEEEDADLDQQMPENAAGEAEGPPTKKAKRAKAKEDGKRKNEKEAQAAKRGRRTEVEAHGVKRKEDAEEVPEEKRVRMEEPEDIEMETPIVKQLRRFCRVESEKEHPRPALNKEQHDIAEVYSPPRVTEEAKKWGLHAGEAMDITTGWDFRDAVQRQRAWDYVGKHKPKLLIGSPMCTMFSQLQTLSGWGPEKERRWGEAVKHMMFVVSLYRRQVREGRLFLHEHPAGAKSWGLDMIKELQEEEGVVTVTGDQCEFGLKTWTQDGKHMIPVRKRTKFMTNSMSIAKELEKKCSGQHVHGELLGEGRPAAAARYPSLLCEAICKGLMQELRWRGHGMKFLTAVTAKDKVYTDPDKNDHEEEEEVCMATAWDDVSGAELNPKEVKKAREKEMGYVNGKKVWTKIPRRKALQRGWKIIKTKWIDINKGDAICPNYRSRIVGMEFNDGSVAGLFAATPPLETLKLLISELATVEQDPEKDEQVMMVNDVARAFFEAPMTRCLCIELPEEDKLEGEEDMVGLLNMSLYGTRDAAANFQKLVKEFMLENGFQVGKFNPCTFWHPTRKIKTLVHGDDFISKAGRKQAAWLKKILETKFEIKTTIVGTGERDVQETRVLNRVIRVTPEGWEYEADQRHAEIIVKQLGLEEAKPTMTPSEEPKEWREEEYEEKLGAREVAMFRPLAARANYLAADRSDIQYATKELCRGMANPNKGDLAKLRRLGRYLVGKPRVVWRFGWQGRTPELHGYTDSDWAGCRRTAKSTSGGAIMRGKHCIKTWSVTQKGITLSSGEAELVAAVKMSTEIIGMTQLLGDWGQESRGHVLVDSSAALGIVRRKGNGRLRHIRVGMLWIQEKEGNGELEYHKVKGENNPADLMTKNVPPRLLEIHMEKISQLWRDGRADCSLELSGQIPSVG